MGTGAARQPRKTPLQHGPWHVHRQTPESPRAWAEASTPCRVETSVNVHVSRGWARKVRIGARSGEGRAASCTNCGISASALASCTTWRALTWEAGCQAVSAIRPPGHASGADAGSPWRPSGGR
eukprot:350819-Chlamydomonas_euryale.AAC.5